MASGDSTFDCVLVEHKSYSEAEMVSQVPGNMSRIWSAYVRENQGRAGHTVRALPPTDSFLGYSGSESSRGPTNLADMIATDAPELVFLSGPDLILRQWAQMIPEDVP